MILDLSNDIDQQKATTYLGKLIDNESVCELRKVDPKRSLSQNSYVHACFGLIAKHTGYTIEEVKTDMKREFGSFMIYSKDSKRYLRSTADLDTKQMTEFIDWLRHYSSETIGVYLMTPDQYFSQFARVYQELEGVK